MVSKLKVFLGEAWIEMHRVNWPSRREVMRLTWVVVALSVILAAVLGVFDFIFTTVLTRYIIS